MPGALERRGEDVDLRWWRGWRCLGEREWRWRGLGVEDGYRRMGEREGEVDMGRRWRAWWCPGEREWCWRGLGVVDGYGRRGERGAWRGVWGEGEWTWCGSGVPGGVGGSGSGGGGGLGWGSCMAGGGRGRWTWGRGGARGGARWSGRDGSGVSGGRGGPWGSGSGTSGSVGAVGECAVRRGSRSAAVCGTGPHRSSRASQEASAAPGGLRLVPPGTGGGGGVPRRPWIRHVGVWWRQRLVVWVEGLSLVGFGPGGPFGVDVVAGGIGIRFLVPGGWLVRGAWPLAVGGVCGWSARLPSHLVVLFVHGGLWPGGVGRWAVVVVGVVLVVVVVGPLVVVVWVVVGLVLRVWPMDPFWFFRSPLWGWGVGHRGQSPGLHYVVGRE